MFMVFPGGSDSNESACNEETWVRSLGQEEPLEKGMAIHPVFLPGKSQGWGSLVGCHLRGRTELDTTEAT